MNAYNNTEVYNFGFKTHLYRRVHYAGQPLELADGGAVVEPSGNVQLSPFVTPSHVSPAIIAR